MSDITSFKEKIHSFSLSELNKYLRYLGFSKTDDIKNSIQFEKYYSEFNETIKIPVPKNEEILNYNESVFNVLMIISSLHNTDFQNIVSNIISVSNDTLRMRLLNVQNMTRSIPLDIAANEIDALKRLFIYGASSEDKARPFFEKPTTIGINHGNQCHFGHTFEGSFGFLINSPIVDDYTQITFEPEEIEIPFERKVLERIAIGLNNTITALDEQSIDPIINNFEYGFNSRMCDAIIEMSNENCNNLVFDIKWSPQIQPTKEYHFNDFIFKPDSFELLKDASRHLKTVEPFDDIVIGRIVTLHSNKIPFLDEDTLRVAIIKHYYDEKPIEVKLELTMDQYKTAYIAHGDGSTVRATGKLYRKGNSWRMIDINRFEIFYS